MTLRHFAVEVAGRIVVVRCIQFDGNFVNAEMVRAFLDSAEYRRRFGP